MLTQEEILKKAILRTSIKTNIIYFLIKNNEIVYVGQSVNGISRIISHIGYIEFDSYYYEEILEEDLNEAETKYIIQFKPKYNRGLPLNNYYKSKYMLTQIYNVPKIKLTYLFKKNKIKSYFKGDYFDLREVEKLIEDNGFIKFDGGYYAYIKYLKTKESVRD